MKRRWRTRATLFVAALACLGLGLYSTASADTYGPLYICGPDGWKASHAQVSGSAVYTFGWVDGVGPQYYWRDIDLFGTIRNGPLTIHDARYYTVGSNTSNANTSQIDTSPPGCARYQTGHV